MLGHNQLVAGGRHDDQCAVGIVRRPLSVDDGRVEQSISTQRRLRFLVQELIVGVGHSN